MLNPNLKKDKNYTGKCMNYLSLQVPKLEYHQKCNYFLSCSIPKWKLVQIHNTQTDILLFIFLELWHIAYCDPKF